MEIKPVVQHMQFMSEDTPICDVWYCLATNYIKVVNHTDNWLTLPFGKKDPSTVTLEYFESILEEFYCFPRTRDKCQEILASMGLCCYDPLAIVHMTHEFMWGTHEWIHFDDDPPGFNYEQLRRLHNRGSD